MANGTAPLAAADKQLAAAPAEKARIVVKDEDKLLLMRAQREALFFMLKVHEAQAAFTASDGRLAALIRKLLLDYKAGEGMVMDMDSFDFVVKQ
jgi:hypothetical protein